MPYVMQGTDHARNSDLRGFGETPAAVPIPGTTLTMTPEEFSLHLYLLVAQLAQLTRVITKETFDPMLSGECRRSATQWAADKARASGTPGALLYAPGGPLGQHPLAATCTYTPPLCDPAKFPIGTLAPDILRQAPIAIPGIAVMTIAASETESFQETSRKLAVEACTADVRRVLKPALGPLLALAPLTQILLGADWQTLVPPASVDALVSRIPYLTQITTGVPRAERLAKGSEMVRRLRLVKPANALKWYQLAVRAVTFGSKQYDLASAHVRQRVAAQYDWGFAATAASIAGAANDVFLALLHGTKEVVTFMARAAGEGLGAAGGGLLEGLMSALGPVLGIAAVVAGGYVLYRVYKKRQATALPTPAPVGAFPMYRR